MLLTAVIGSLLAISFLGTGSAQQDSMHYTILAPSAFRVSTVYNVTATFYNVEAAVQLSLRLESENGLLVESEATLEKGVTEIISLQIPDFVPEATYTLYADGTGGLTFSNSHAVNVTRKTLSIFVQTDKAIYKPGQTVLFRAIVVHSDLKPSKESVNIDVYDQYGNVIEQWRDQTNDAGVISQKIVLSDQTPLGDCQIVVTAGENSFTKTFQVAVLPPIEVSVSVPSYLLLNDNNRDLQEDLPITVNAEYENGQPVKGGTTITIQLKPFDWEENPYYTKYVLDAQLVNGRAEVILKLKDITPDPWEEWEYRKLIVVADVNETVKGIIYSGNSTVYVRPEKYWLAFLPSSPGSFKPGFLYTGYFQLAKLDGSAPDLADITLPSGAYKDIAVQTSFDKPGPGYEHIGDQVISVTFTPTGIMNFSVMMDSNAGFVSFSIILNVDVTNSEIGSSHNIFAFASRDNQAIQVSYNSEDGLIKTNQNAVFTVITTEPITNFQYQIMSKGNILLSDNVVGDASTEHSFSIWISKELAVELAPKARVVVLFRTDAGEIVTDSTEISISDIFANEVSLSFDRESVTPSENVSVTINAYPGSYVGILAVDKSVLLLKPGNDISQETVSEDLSGYDSVPDDFVGSSDSSSILEKSGLFLLTDGFIYPKKMEDPPYLSDWSYANTHPRVKVPETWLWIDAITGPDGKVTIQVTVPDTKTSWVASAFGVSSVAGLGIAASTVNLNNVYETYDASGIDLNVKTTQNGNKITVTICTSWTNKEESGKMVMEVAELTGYDVSNLDDLKNRVQDIKRVEYKNGILFLYFDKLTAVETCVDVISDKVSPASSVKDAPIRVYPYPSRGRTVFYAHPQALSQTSP